MIIKMVKIGRIAFSDVLEMKFPVDTESLKEFKYILFYEDGTRSLTTSSSSFTNKGISNILEIDQKEESQDLADERSGSMDFRFTDTFGVLDDVGFGNKPKDSQEPKIYSFSGNADELRDYFKSLDLEKEAPVKEPNSVFKLDDTVHVLSYSNIGEFGKSTEGVVRAIYKDGTILVKVEEGIEEVHNEDNVSFTPFSIREAGFSQVRPVREPKEGGYGFFYDNKPATSIYYDKLFNIDKNEDFKYVSNQSEENFKYFSIEPPQLAVDIPNPFKEC